MGIMRDLNQYLKKRGNRWHYVRRVPKEYQFFDKRGTVYKSLKTESLELARARRDALMEADNQYWASVMASDTLPMDIARRSYRSAQRRAMAKGFVYTPVQDLADVATLAEIIDRLQAIPKDPVPDKKEADAVLGLVERPSVKISKAMELYCDEIAVSELLGKSEEQKKSWRKVKMRALNNFIKVVGDLPMHKITRDHARKYYNWWGARVTPKDGSKPLTTNSANRDLGNIRKLYREFWEYEGEENRENPFRNLSFAKQPPKDVPCFSDEFVRTRFLKPGILDGLNAEATLLVYPRMPLIGNKIDRESDECNTIIEWINSLPCKAADEMSSINSACPGADEKFLALGEELPPIPKLPNGFNFVQAKQVGPLLYVSGMGPQWGQSFKEEFVGKVWQDISMDQAYAAARLTGLNLLHVIREHTGSLDNVHEILELFAMVNASPDFKKGPLVVNGCSDLLVEIFGEQGKHVRTAASSDTPFDISVYIKMSVRVGNILL